MKAIKEFEQHFADLEQRRQELQEHRQALQGRKFELEGAFEAHVVAGHDTAEIDQEMTAIDQKLIDLEKRDAILARAAQTPPTDLAHKAVEEARLILEQMGKEYSKLFDRAEKAKDAYISAIRDLGTLRAKAAKVAQQGHRVQDGLPGPKQGLTMPQGDVRQLVLDGAGLMKIYENPQFQM